MSIRVGRDEAEQKFSELISQVSKGEEIEIVSDGEGLARLIPSPSIQNYQGVVEVSEGDDELFVQSSTLSQTQDYPEVALQELRTELADQSYLSSIEFSSSVYSIATNLTVDENFEPLENQNELDEIIENISLIQSRMEEERLEIETSIKNIDNMLALLED